MRVALDTSAYSAFVRGDARLKKWINSKNMLFVSSIVLGELRSGFAAGTIPVKNETMLQRMLDASNVMTITISDTTTHDYANIYKGLRLKGTPIGTNDMWIAALCIEHKLPLVTLDNDFNNVSGLKTLIPT